MTTIELDVRATMESDWHIGSGEGRTKAIDSAVLRDAAGLPYLPAKSLTGVLRDRAEQLADALDEGRDDMLWHQWLRWVFGSRPDREAWSGDPATAAPDAAALITEPLRLTSLLDADMVADELGITPDELFRATTVDRTSVAIDRYTGTARPEKLRTEERARAGLELRGSWSLRSPGSTDDLWPAVFLIQAAARLTYAVGGKRRRGAGEVTLTVQASGVKDLNLLAAAAVGEAPPAPPTRDVGTEKPADRPEGDLHHAWNLTITAVSPLLVGTTTRGNTVTSATSVPGTTLLPLVMKALNLDSAAVREGRVVVTPATPAVTVPTGTGPRSIPWPAVLARPKGKDSGPAVNTARPHHYDAKLKAAGDRYIVRIADTWVDFTPNLVQHMHVAVHPDRDSEVFTYEAIAPGTAFIAEIWLPANTPVPKAASLPKNSRLGVSKKDDYGAVSLAWAKPSPHPTPRSFTEGDEFDVLLESPVLLRDAGATSPTVDRLLAALGESLGVGLTEAAPLRERDGTAERVTVTRAVSAVRIDSWQTRWSLPRPSLVGLAAGSVVRVACDGPIPADVAVLAQGIGDRTAEGFGRVRLAPAILDEDNTALIPFDEFDEPDTAKRTSTPRSRQAQIPEDARRTVREAVLRERIARSVTELAADPARRRAWMPSGASAAQIGVVRGLALGLGTAQGTAAFRRWRDGALKIEKRKQVWATVAGECGKVLDSLESQDENGALVWTKLDPNGTGDQFQHLLVDVPPGRRSALALSAFQHLLVESARTESKARDVR